ncbi:hypothetical protein E2320_020637, partial [Naja naja]
ETSYDLKMGAHFEILHSENHYCFQSIATFAFFLLLLEQSFNDQKLYFLCCHFKSNIGQAGLCGAVGSGQDGF